MNAAGAAEVGRRGGGKRGAGGQGGGCIIAGQFVTDTIYLRYESKTKPKDCGVDYFGSSALTLITDGYSKISFRFSQNCEMNRAKTSDIFVCVFGLC